MRIAIFFLVVYIIGFIVALGVRGGIRDEMEGIGDMVFVVFWPLTLMFWFMCMLVGGLYEVGREIAKPPSERDDYDPMI